MILQGRPVGEVIHCSIGGPVPRHHNGTVVSSSPSSPSGFASIISIPSVGITDGAFRSSTDVITPTTLILEWTNYGGRPRPWHVHTGFPVSSCIFSS